MSIWNAANVTRVCRTCFASLAGIGFAIMSASLAEAVYGPQAVIGASYQQSSTTTSINGINAGSCDGASICYVLFQPVPEQKALVIQHVSCNADVNTGDLQAARLETRKGQASPLRFTILMPVRTVNNLWLVSSPVTHLVETNERPRVLVINNTNADWGLVACNVSGKLQQP
jgi:hypothetical protein